MEPRTNYIALLIIIILGVTAGNLISNWITAKFVEAEVQKEVAEISNVISKKSNETKEKIKKQVEPIKIVETASQSELMESRKQDENGIRLAKNCSEWRVAHEDMKTQTSERGMKKHCDQYEEYIRTGALPPSH